MDVVKPYDLSPTEFEEYCEKIFKGYGEKERLSGFEILHDVEIETHDGKYQIDLYATFTAFGSTEFKIICECKRYRSRVKREVVAALYAKVQSIGAHKGILISTSAFQKGAIQYAKEHGIALVQMTEYGPEHFSHSSGPHELDENDPFLYAERMLPPYRAIDCTSDAENNVIYPTAAMLEEIYAIQDRMIKEWAGIKDSISSEDSL